MSRRARSRIRSGRVLRWAVVAFLLAWVLAPLYFLAILAFTSKADSLVTPPKWLPPPNFGNFHHILASALSGQPPASPSDLIIPGIKNSALVAISVAALNIIIGSLAGYAFARYRFPGSRVLPTVLLGTQLVPVFALIIPFYVLLRHLHLTDTRAGIIIAQLSFTIPFSVWLLRSFFTAIPREVERAGVIDGCNRWQVFYRVILPLGRPGIVSVGLFSFMVSWNDFLFPIVLNSQVGSMMIQPAISGLYNVRQQSFGIMAAGTLMAALPTMLLALLAQRFLVRGLTSGIGKV